jgi:hypothetical protein
LMHFTFSPWANSIHAGLSSSCTLCLDVTENMTPQTDQRR